MSADNFAGKRNFSTLVELLKHRALYDKDAYIFPGSGEGEEVKLTFSSLDRQSEAIATELRKQCRPGDRALLLYPTGPEFISAFFGCLYAGVVAVPCRAPNPKKLRADLDNLTAVAADCSPKVILTTGEFMDSAIFILPDYPGLEKTNWLVSGEIDAAPDEEEAGPEINVDDVAFLQYTSGSTGDPKGVMVSHGNALYNVQMLERFWKTTEDDVIVCWVPFFHDMGLVANILLSLHSGARCVCISPASFLRKPERWLRTISRYRGSVTCGPDFAYELCVDRINPEKSPKIDLSCLRILCNGGEPVRAETLRRFTEAFEFCGFKSESHRPGYGMAEATVFVSGGETDKPPVIENVDKIALRQNMAVFCETGQKNSRPIVGCGKTWLDQKIIIVDPETLTRVSDNRTGEIWVSGPNVARGYWNRPELTKKTFQARLAGDGEGPFLRSGDLGFMKNGELFVTGRLKDLIIIRGLNHYPQDIELTAGQSHESLRPGRSAAFSVEVGDEEKLVVAQEIKRDGAENSNADEMVEAIRKNISAKHNLMAWAVVLVKAGSIPKTSSGKIRRRACKRMFLENGLGEAAEKISDFSSFPVSDEMASLMSKYLKLDMEKLRRENSASKRRSALLSYLTAKIAFTLKIPVFEIDPGRPAASLGIDSLQAMRIKDELEENIKLDLDIVALLEEEGGLAAYAEIVDRLLSESVSAPAGGADKRDKRSFPLSQGQKALYSNHRLFPENPAYNAPLALRIYSPVDAETMKEAARIMVRRHAALRAVISSDENGEPFQNVLREDNCHWEMVDAGEWEEGELKAKVKAAYEAPFNLRKGPLIRFHLFRIREDHSVLLITAHRIVFDGWSKWNLIDELAMVYQARISGAEVNLPRIPASYYDFVYEEKKTLSGAKGMKLWKYWKNQLSGNLPPLKLPLDYPRPPRRSFSGAVHLFTPGRKLSARIRKMAQKEKVTLFTLLLAVYQILLNRYSSQDDILVTAAVSGRLKPKFDRVVGYFVDSIALRGDLSNDVSFRQFLTKTWKVVLEGLKHQEYPFALLAKELRPERDPDYSPLSQAAFSLQRPKHLENMGDWLLDEARPKSVWAGMKMQIFETMWEETAEFDLMMEITEEKERLLGALKYNPDIFKPETMAKMSKHFVNLLRAAVFDPLTKISRLPLLAPEDEKLALEEWSGPKVDYPGDKCVHHLFEERALKAPDAPSVVFTAEDPDRENDRQLSYAELNSGANQLARRLQSMGIGPETPVAICAKSSPEMIIGVMGILKAGGACVPLDPSYPKEYLAYMLGDSGAPILLAQSGLLDSLPEHRKTICLDTDEETAGESEENAVSPVKPDNLAYIIYTAGLDGKPKGTMIQHSSLVNSLFWHLKAFEIGPSDRATQLTGSAPDSSIRELWPYLIAGASVYSIEPDILVAPKRLWAWMLSRKITISFLPAPIAEEALCLKRLKNDGPRLILTGGDKLGKHPSDSPPFEVVNNYGLTESSLTAVSGAVASVKQKDATPPIGRPIANTQVYILDAEQTPVPIGVLGEIHIGGEGLARGYLNLPELTSKKFIPNPFDDKSDSRLYKSGDLARYLPDGNIEFLGRLDNQVKIRGFRVEPDGVAEVLRQHPHVKEAMALARGNNPGNKRLTAYVAPDLESCKADISRKERREYISSLQSAREDVCLPPLFSENGQFEVIGRQSALAGRSITEEEMNEWLDDTVDQIISLRPRRVLEIDCGRGALLFRLAPRCRSYRATDFSSDALSFIRRQLDEPEQRQGPPRVELFAKRADRLEEALDKSFDTVIMNSAVQYFPDLDYLLQTLESVITAISDGGSIFIGDVRNFALLETFHASEELNRASSATPVVRLGHEIRRRTLQENELLVSPEFFTGLKKRFPKISRVKIQLKTGRHQNEMTRFRYDVIIEIQKENVPSLKNYSWATWSREKPDATKIARKLEKNQPDFMGIARVPNRRLLKDFEAARMIRAISDVEIKTEKLRDELEKMKTDLGIDPAKLRALTEKLPYRLELSWADSDSSGRYDVLFIKRNYSGPAPVFKQKESSPASRESLASDPPLAAKIRRLADSGLREYLRRKLPEFMIPSAFVMLETAPMDSDDETNRETLPESELKPLGTRKPAAPRDVVEEILARLWGKLLGLTEVGVLDNFFELGGHSLLAVQAIAQIRKTFGVEVDSRNFFARPTVTAVAEMIKNSQTR